MHGINVELVQRTWEQVLPIADDAAQLFYNRLFELDPSQATPRCSRWHAAATYRLTRLQTVTAGASATCHPQSRRTSASSWLRATSSRKCPPARICTSSSGFSPTGTMPNPGQSQEYPARSRSTEQAADLDRKSVV